MAGEDAVAPSSAARQPDRGGPGRVDRWYFAYALLGATQSGMIPILLPLTSGASGGAAHAGAVIAAVNLGGLAAPLWGYLADRWSAHRGIMVGGLAAAACGLMLFAIADTLAARTVLALLVGVGMAAANTAATLLVIDAHPREEWDSRLGALQTFYGAGQTLGLLLAGPLGHLAAIWGLGVAAGLTALAVPIAWRNAAGPVPAIRQAQGSHGPPVAGEWAPGAMLGGHIRLPIAKWLQQIRRLAGSPFGWFLAAWCLSYMSSAAVFALYPVAMLQDFGIAPAHSAAAFAAAAGFSLLLYVPAGTWADRWGGMAVLGTGLALRVVAFVGLAGLGLMAWGDLGWVAPLVFCVAVLAWPLLSVAGNALAARLSPTGRGEGMGIFNAASALAATAGALIGGWIVAVWGYGLMCALAAIMVTAGFGFAILTAGKLPRPRQKLPSDTT
jgi:MFS transporter, DHA1 family, tetracycline resistance protein